MEKKIFVMIRYSILAKQNSPWEIAKVESEPSYESTLFDDNRLQAHRHLFENVALPSLKVLAESGKLTAFVFTSESLPYKHKSYLYDTVKNLSWVKVVELGRDKSANAMMNEYLSNYINTNYDSVCYATTRLDDDDALANSFGNRLERYLMPEFNNMAVSFYKGYKGFLDKGVYSSFSKASQHKCAQGLTYIKVKESGKPLKGAVSVFSLGHHGKVEKKCPVILDGCEEIYLRTIHSESDIYEKMSGSDRKEIVGDSIIKEKFSLII